MTKIASETKCTVVVVGDSRTGKSALLQRFVHKKFTSIRIPFHSKSNKSKNLFFFMMFYVFPLSYRLFPINR